ncbi:MAG: peptidoglycan DD-metalloendopeptidase family protein [Candidatus Magasanikbacteria bacterium]|jgi:LysM repeat protein|nr:peptidoglycan DD-metalloendopeptidase family protein [Candidatus Magasanikbacteria bacterium]
MKFYLYKAFLLLLRSLIYVKRGLAYVFNKLILAITKVHSWYAAHIGFHLYKIWFILKKRLVKYKIPLDGRFVEFFGRRGTLQILLFVIGTAVLFPHSALYSQEIERVPGRQTLLYALVGPGEQDFAAEDIIIEEVGLPTEVVKEGQAWREGALALGQPGALGRDSLGATQDISSVSAGGTALTKPTILPGSELPADDSSAPTQEVESNRKNTVTYTVQSGDVIGRIATRFGVSLETVLWANNLTYRSYIRPGDVLDILPVSGVKHTVKRGETVSKIASTYDADSSEIIAFNKLQRDGGDIVIGEELIIPDGEKPQPVRTVVARPRVDVSESSQFRNVAAPPPSVQTPAGSGFLWPTGATIITQYSNWQHIALDIAGPIGTPLYASKGGTVIRSQCGWNGGYGCYVILDHGGGVQTLYAHASKLLVSLGDSVAQGQTVALMGSTGRSTGPHIHYEVRVNGKRQNPLRYVRK